MSQLNKLIKPHLLRREKEDVEHTLPGMKETLLYVEITNLQKMCYRAVLERNRELLQRGASPEMMEGAAHGEALLNPRIPCFR